MNLIDSFSVVQNYFSPNIIGEVNDQYIKIAKINGEKVPWHNHEKEDEGFFIVDGEGFFISKDYGKTWIEKNQYFEKNITMTIVMINMNQECS